MSNQPNRREELWELADAVCNGTLTEAERDRLEAILRADDNAKRTYIAYLDMHARIGWRFRRSRENLSSAEMSDELDAMVANRAASSKRIWFAATLSLAVAVLVVTAASLWLLRSAGSRNTAQSRVENRDSVVRVNRTVDCTWADAGDVLPGQGLTPDRRCELVSGLVELTDPNGARLTFAGPAIFRFVSSTRLNVERGRMTASIPEGHSGMTVQTPVARIVDIGTEFGVEVASSGATEVHVFSGAVDVTTQAEAAGANRRGIRLEQQQTASIAGEGHQVEIDRVPFDERRFHPDVAQQRRPDHLLLHETFDGPLRDDRWRVVQTGEGSKPSHASRAAVVDGVLEIKNRAYVTTARQFDPVRLQGIRITGSWRFDHYGTDGNGFDLLAIVVRSDGRPNPQRFHEVSSGIQFRMDTRNARPVIKARGDDLAITKPVAIGELEIREGQTYRFTIVDDGTNVAFTLAEAGNPQNSASVTAVVVTDTSKTNYIAFYTRERSSSNHIAHLDDIKIYASRAAQDQYHTD